MTDEEWHEAMLAKLDAWLACPLGGYKGLLRHMQMNTEAFCTWRETGHVDKTTRLLNVIFDDEICDRIWGEHV